MSITITPRVAEIFEMRFVDGLTYKEIAPKIGVKNEGSVKNVVNRCLKAARNQSGIKTIDQIAGAYLIQRGRDAGLKEGLSFCAFGQK